VGSVVPRIDEVGSFGVGKNLPKHAKTCQNMGKSDFLDDISMTTHPIHENDSANDEQSNYTSLEHIYTYGNAKADRQKSQNMSKIERFWYIFHVLGL